MKKIVGMLAAMMLVGGIALANPDNFGENGEAWYEGEYSMINVNQEGLRFDWDEGDTRWVVPGDAGDHAGDTTETVDDHYGETMIDPTDSYPE